MTAPSGAVSAPAHPEYLAALYEMAEENIPTVQARLAEWMGISAGAVSQAVKRLTQQGMLVADGRVLRFTSEGERVAEALVRRHRLAEHFLIRVIGLPWHKAHQEAERWERVISPDVEERMVVILDDPGTCPHGNPIPGSSHRVDYSRLVPLQDVDPGAPVVLRRLTEDLELDLDVMRFFEDSGLMPGARIVVKRRAPDGTLGVEVDGEPVAVGAHLSDNLWVEPKAGRRRVARR